MDFSLTDQQIEFKQTIAEFAKKTLNSNVMERDKNRIFSRMLWKKCAEMGIFALPLPERYGGLGVDTLSMALAMEGLGYGCNDNGLVFAINTQLWSGEIPILHFGTEEQKERYLPLLCSGDMIGGHAMTEPDHGSDAFGIRTHAKRIDGGYVLNGSKVFITNAPVADILIVFAVTAPEKKFMGISAFIVERKTDGLTFGKNIDMMGLRTCPIGEFGLQDCFVPECQRLGNEGAGSAIFNSEMELERTCLFACHVGVIDKLTEICCNYTRTRSQGENLIGSYQSVAHKIADMRVRSELARNLIYKIAWMKDRGKSALLESSIAKLYISEAVVLTCTDAMQIHGAYGYSEEYEIERFVRDAMASTIYSGTTEIQRNTIARFLGLPVR